MKLKELLKLYVVCDHMLRYGKEDTVMIKTYHYVSPADPLSIQGYDFFAEVKDCGSAKHIYVKSEKDIDVDKEFMKLRKENPLSMGEYYFDE